MQLGITGTSFFPDAHVKHHTADREGLLPAIWSSRREQEGIVQRDEVSCSPFAVPAFVHKEREVHARGPIALAESNAPLLMDTIER